MSTSSSLTRRQALVVLAGTLLGVLVTARLGLWQLDRAAQKESLQRALTQNASMPEIAPAALARSASAADAQHYRRVRLHGRWVAEATVFLDNRQMNGRPGFYVVTPLVLSGTGHGANGTGGDSDAGTSSKTSEAVLVQRGWAPRDQLDRMRLPPVETPSGDVEVAGHIAPPPSRLYDFGGAASGAIRQNLELGAFAGETGLRLLPLSVVQDDTPGTGAASDGLLRQWPRPTVDVHKHYGYAFQWFALCALMAGLYVWFQLVRPRLQGRT